MQQLLHVMAFSKDFLMAVLFEFCATLQVNGIELYAVRQSKLQIRIEQKGGSRRKRFLPIISLY